MSGGGTPIYRKSNAYGEGDPQLHETLPEMVAALCDVDPWFQSPKTIFDPACGPGAIVWVLQLFGHRTIAADLHDYSDRYRALGEPFHKTFWNKDFLSWSRDPIIEICPDEDAFAIAMNPPYGTGKVGDPSYAAMFVDHALTLSNRVYALLNSDFVHAGKGCPWRDRLLDSEILTGVFPFRERPTLHRDAYEGERKRGVINYTWFRWERSGGDREWQRLTLERGGRARDVSSI